MYVTSGNDDVFALDARTGALIWEHKSGIDQNITTVCCGWDNRGVALGDGKVFLGQLDGNFVALDPATGDLVWKTEIGKWQDGYTITSAPTYYNGVVYTGVSGGDRSARGKLTALDAKTGNELWRFWTARRPRRARRRHLALAEDPDPTKRNAYLNGGANVWQPPAIDPELGLIYLQHRTAGPRRDRRRRQSPRRQPLQLVDRGAASRRQLCVAFPDGASRSLGLRLPEPGGPVRSGL